MLPRSYYYQVTYATQGVVLHRVRNNAFVSVSINMNFGVTNNQTIVLMTQRGVNLDAGGFQGLWTKEGAGLSVNTGEGFWINQWKDIKGINALGIAGLQIDPHDPNIFDTAQICVTEYYNPVFKKSKGGLPPISYYYPNISPATQATTIHQVRNKDAKFSISVNVDFATYGNRAVTLLMQLPDGTWVQTDGLMQAVAVNDNIWINQWDQYFSLYGAVAFRIVGLQSQGISTDVASMLVTEYYDPVNNIGYM